MTKFSKMYPHITWWVDNHGWMDVGTDDYSDSLIRLLDQGGTWWQDETSSTIDEALQNAETFLMTDLPDRFGDKFTLET